MILPGRNGGGLCRDAAMPRDNLAGSIEPISSSAGCSSLALHTDDRKESPDGRPACLENPRLAGAESTLTETVASPFQAEPRHSEEQELPEMRERPRQEKASSISHKKTKGLERRKANPAPSI